MDLHWIAGVAVLLILVAVSAYREALESDATMRAAGLRRDGADSRDVDRSMERA
ncbi:hypothetical protein WKR88_17095 [Trinickia caryophylli]|uniref:Uncharacterized protein n=1 Tax=Trinickia caryophylli TaxID=28094 RepID=A0A1X7G2H6_TRICW|nr:hypothetical protein [Trinickia caryophylli]WQE14027.1 hypothetical protein U0034_25330 [Trinickia caryophylli]GLU33486.1 hypothetical protein Busp01_33280 [Trinickia caryophylli]SMF62843.1 hypothetical protein SAMN06295900_11344 [Trinickia caryophylli]